MKLDIIKDTINIGRFFFILSVVSAHCSFRINNLFFERLWEVFGTIGVIGFFIISGYLYQQNKDSISVFIYKKIITICIPWIFCGSIIYIASAFFGENTSFLSFIEYIYFIIGNGSLYYYLTILLILFISYKLIGNNALVILCLSIISIINLLTNFNKSTFVFSPYLNILNWAIFFNIGFYISKYKLERFIFQLQWKGIIGLIFLLVINLFFTISRDYITYFDSFNIFNELISVYLFMVLSYKIAKKKDRYCFLSDIGKKSFSIYLIHMPVAGAFNLLISENSLFLQIFKPIFIICIVSYMIKLYKIVVKKFIGGSKENLLLIILGSR